MYYYLYKITNLVNGKIYIGRHKTKNLDDGYFGSGHVLKKAIQKHGAENFMLHIECFLQNDEELNLLEQTVVDEDFINNDMTYNVKLGGKLGQWSEEVRKHMRKVQKIAQNTPEAIAKQKAAAAENYQDPEYHKRISEGVKRAFANGALEKLRVRQQTDEYRLKQSLAHKGKRLSDEHKARIAASTCGWTKLTHEQHVKGGKNGGAKGKGKHWYNNGEIERESFECPGEGWTKGRLKRKNTHE